MNTTSRRKYLPYFIIGGILLILGGLLAWRELNKSFDKKDNTDIAVNTKNSSKEVISSDSITLSNGRSVIVEFQLTDVTAIQDYNQFGNGPKDNYIYYGQGQIQVLDSDNKSKILDTYKINALDYYAPQLNSLKLSQLTFQDYNNDKNPDFTIVQPHPYTGALFYIYSIDKAGKISRLDTDGIIQSNSFNQGNLSASIDCYNGVFFGWNCYYRWNKTKFEKGNISFGPLTYDKNGIENLEFSITDQPRISFNSGSVIPNKTDPVTFNCSLNIKVQGIEIFVRTEQKVLLNYTYYFNTNSILKSDFNQEDILNLSDDQLKDVGKACKEVMDFALKSKGFAELIK